MAGDVLRHTSNVAMTFNGSRQRPWPGGQRPDYCHCRLEGECQCTLIFVTPTSSPMMTSSSRKHRRHVRFVDTRALDESSVVDDVSIGVPRSGNWWESPPPSSLSSSSYFSSRAWEDTSLHSPLCSLEVSSHLDDNDQVDNAPLRRFDSNRQMALIDDDLAEQHLAQVCSLLNNSSTCSSVSDLMAEASLSLNTSSRSSDSLHSPIHQLNGYANGHAEPDQGQGCNGHHHDADDQQQQQQKLVNGSTRHHEEASKSSSLLPEGDTEIDAAQQQLHQPVLAAVSEVSTTSQHRVRPSSPTVPRSRKVTKVRSTRRKSPTGFLETNLDDLLLGDSNGTGGYNSNHGNHAQNGIGNGAPRVRYCTVNHCTDCNGEVLLSCPIGQVINATCVPAHLGDQVPESAFLTIVRELRGCRKTQGVVGVAYSDRARLLFISLLVIVISCVLRLQLSATLAVIIILASILAVTTWGVLAELLRRLDVQCDAVFGDINSRLAEDNVLVSLVTDDNRHSWHETFSLVLVKFNIQPCIKALADKLKQESKSQHQQQHWYDVSRAIICKHAASYVTMATAGRRQQPISEQKNQVTLTQSHASSTPCPCQFICRLGLADHVPTD